MGVTQKNVADRAGVTRSVVSHVLHGGAGTIRVSPATAEHVRRVAMEMGYQPNAYARNFRQRRTGMIGVVHGDGFPRLRFGNGSAYFSVLMDGIIDGAFEHGYTVGICPDLFGRNPESAMADGRFDGFIWYSTHTAGETEQRINRCTAPMVLLHWKAKQFNERFPTVICDNEEGIRLAIDHLAEHGHRQIGFVFDGRCRSVESELRHEIVIAQGRRLGLTIASLDLTDREHALEAYFMSSPKETALIAHSEEYAVEAMHVAQSNGFRIPDHMSIIGFDSTVYCLSQTPPLTSISQPLEAMAMQAVDMLIDLIEGRKSECIEAVFPCGLDIRGSTGPARI